MASGSHSVFTRILSNTGVLITGRVVNAVCSFVYVAWTAQTLGLDAFGVMILVTTFASLVSDITHLQSWQALLHYGTAPFSQKKYDQFYNILAFCVRADFLSGAVGMICGLGAIMLVGPVFLGWPASIKPDALLCMLTILFMNTGWSTGMLRLCNRFKLVTFYEFITTCVRTGGCGIGYLLHLGLGYFLFVWCATQLTMFLSCTGAGLYLLRKQTGAFLPLKTLLSPVRNMPGIWKFTLSTSVNQVLESVFQQGGTLVIGAVLGAGEAAVYRVARQISNGLSKPAQMMLPTLYPEFIRFRDKQDWLGMRQVTLKLFGLIAAFSILVFLLTITVGNSLFSYMLHHSWPGQKTILVLLVSSALLDIGLVPLEPLLTVLGQIAMVLRARITVIAVYFPLLYVLLLQWGVDGAALSSVLASFLMVVVCGIPVFSFLCGRKNKKGLSIFK